MNILEELITLLSTLGIKIETGVIKNDSENSFIVLVPLADTFKLNANDAPNYNYEEVRITIFSKNNYLKLKNSIINLLLANYFYITQRIYNGYETKTGYYEYTIDVAKNYEIREE